MSSVLRVVVGLALCLDCVPAAADGPDGKPRAKVEVRRAETEPGEGLTEAAVVGTTDKAYLHASPDATGEHVAEARATEDDAGHPAIEVTFTKEGAKKMAALSEAHRGRPVALVVGGTVVSAPRVAGAFSGKGVFVGRFTKQEAEGFVKVINGK